MSQNLQQTNATRLSSVDGTIRNTELVFRRNPVRGYVNGVEQIKTRAATFENEDSITIYTAIEWQDEATGGYRYSCNCPAYCIWKNKAKDRECKHTKQLAENLTMGNLSRTPRSNTTTDSAKPGVVGEVTMNRRQRNIG